MTTTFLVMLLALEETKFERGFIHGQRSESNAPSSIQDAGEKEDNDNLNWFDLQSYQTRPLE